MKKVDYSARFSRIATAIRRDLALIVELAAIALIGITFFASVLDLSSGASLPGDELGAHIGQTQLMIDWLNGQADFPLWNPAMGLGRTWIADPFLFAYNPFATVPMWLLGLTNGAKVAVAINFLLAGFGMWVVTRLLRFRWPTRIWASLLYMMSGGIVAHLYAGQLQLAFSLGWLPWSFASLLWVWKKKTYASAAVASLAQALFFFSGNLYHQVYAVVCYIIIVFVLLVEWRPLKLDWSGLWKFAVLGILSVGLISIQLIPFLAGRKDIGNQGGYAPNEQEFYGSQTPVNAILNYIVSDLEFNQAEILGKVPFLQENYRYIGITPFLLASILILPAFKRSPHKREIVAIVLSFTLLLCWTAVRYTFFKDLYHTIPYLSQFRWPGRALSVGAMFIILLGGFGLEELLARIDSVRLNVFFKGTKQSANLTVSGRIALLVLVLLGLAWSVRDVHSANSVYLSLESKSQLYAENGFRWLKNLEQEEYTFGVYATSAISSENGTAGYLNQLRLRSIQDGWNAGGAPLNLGRAESINIEPQYWLLWEGEPLDNPGAVVVKEIGPLRIWEIPVFPYAFTIPVGRFDVEPFVVSPDEAQPVVSFARDLPNGIVIETNSRIDSILIVGEAWSSGWRVTVDGQRADPGSVCNLLAIPLPPGKHTVTFDYAPASFGLGVMLSFLAILAIAVILLGGLVRKRKSSLPKDSGTP